jgi:hypothetical protein
LAGRRYGNGNSFDNAQQQPGANVKVTPGTT